MQGDLIAPFQNLRGADKKDEDRLCSRARSTGAYGYGFKLREGRCSLDIRKTLPAGRVVKHCKSFPSFPFSQKGSGCPLAGKIPGQAGQGSEQPCSLQGLGLDGPYRALPGCSLRLWIIQRKNCFFILFITPTYTNWWQSPLSFRAVDSLRALQKMIVRANVLNWRATVILGQCWESKSSICNRGWRATFFCSSCKNKTNI